MNFLVYVYHIWRMKYWIIIITAAVTLLAWYMTGMMSKTYQAEALIFVKRNQGLNPMERKDLDPPVFQDLLKTDALLTAVKNEYIKRYPNDDKPLKIFRKRFRVKGEVLTETAVRKDYSPIVTITATAGSEESAALLVNTWQAQAIQMYGDLIAKEEALYYQYLLDQYNTIDAGIQTAQVKFSSEKWQLAAKIQSLSNWMDILAPSTLAVLPTEPKPQTAIEIVEQPSIFDLSVSDSSVMVDRKGLQNDLIDLDVEIARLTDEAEALRVLLKDEPQIIKLGGPDVEQIKQLVGDMTPDKIKEFMNLNLGSEVINPHYQHVKKMLVVTETNLRAKKAGRQLVVEKIAEVEQKIAALQSSIAELEPRVQQHKRDIERFMKEKRLIEERLNVSALSYRQLKWSAQDPMDTSTLFSAMQAVAPYQVGPKRLTYTGLIGIASLMFVTLLVMLSVFVGDLEAMYGKKIPAAAAPAKSSKSAAVDAPKSPKDDMKED